VPNFTFGSHIRLLNVLTCGVDLPKGELTYPAVLLSFQVCFDFSQYFGNLSRHIIYTACTIRIIL